MMALERGTVCVTVSLLVYYVLLFFSTPNTIYAQ